MKLQQVIKIIEAKYDKKRAFKDDFIGLQVKGKDQINNILICLDFTDDFINELKEYKIDLIIAHHPLFFGDKKELLAKDPILQKKYQLLKDLGINFYVLHTNIDFDIDSIPYNQAKKLDCRKIKLIDDKKAISCILNKEFLFKDFIKFVRLNLQLKYDPFKTNLFIKDQKIKKLIIGSGASGDLLEKIKEKDALYIIGELKHHHWIFASDNNLNVLEIGHQSERIFVDIVENFLFSASDNNLRLYKIYEYKYKNC